MRRGGKPQQQIYRPGSGPLRRTAHNPMIEMMEPHELQPVQEIEPYSRRDTARKRNEHDDDAPLDYNELHGHDETKRRQRKPDQTFYVPKPVAQARELCRSTDNLHARDTHLNGDFGGSTERVNSGNNRSKRYSNRKKHNEPAGIYGEEAHDRWRPNNPPHIDEQHRNARQGSEPRLHEAPNWSRSIRDTRSVEHARHANHPASHSGEKVYFKPPSGRRHSTIGLEQEKMRGKMPNLEALPPRFQRKYLEENKLNVSYIGTQSEVAWDGSSLTFQGSNSSNPQTGHFPKQSHSMGNFGGGSPHPHPQSYYTLPYRGRGRARATDTGNVGGGAPYRSTTPDRHLQASGGGGGRCRPPTPPPSFHQRNRARSNENLNQADTRPVTPTQRLFRSERFRGSCERLEPHPPSQNEEQFPGPRQTVNNDQNHQRMANISRDENNRNIDDRRTDQCDTTVTHTTDDKMQKSDNRALSEKGEREHSPAPAPSPPICLELNLLPVSSDILDWSKEVELQKRLEGEETVSDTPTRSSSVNSLVDASISSTSQQHQQQQHHKFAANKPNSGGRNRNRRRRRSRSKREPSAERQAATTRTRHNSYNTEPSREFKVPEGRAARRRRRSREKSFDQHKGTTMMMRSSRESSYERAASHEPENWREEILRSRHNSERGNSREPPDLRDLDLRKAGVLILPPPQREGEATRGARPLMPRYPDVAKPLPTAAAAAAAASGPGTQQKSLFDPNNPHRPIIVKAAATSARARAPGFDDNADQPPPQLHTDQFGNVQPVWYDDASDECTTSKYAPLLREIRRAYGELQAIVNEGLVLVHWETAVALRRFLMDSLATLLCNDVRFCEKVNIEQHLWKILYYNIIEMVRKSIGIDAANNQQYKEFLLWLIDEGVQYYEGLLDQLERTYNFKLSDYVGGNSLNSAKGLKYVGLALISMQKILLFLGDLYRYRELVNGTTNYGRCRQYYIKANEISPKNGKPYNQLALLALYSKRRLDAVYYYMRSLMSSNPVPTARQSLLLLLDENRKKYEQGEKKRKEARQQMKQKESETREPSAGSLRRETWFHPDGLRNVHRITPAVRETQLQDSDEENLAALPCADVNKRFVMSYLHVQGKLNSKVGMESFQDASRQMLKEFRALLQHSPVPLNTNRFLQLLALNMFAIENTHIKEPQFQAGYKSELQERALVISFEMFNLILERCVSLLSEAVRANNLPLHPTDKSDVGKIGLDAIPQDFHIIIPAVKTWCDWMLCHSSVWNPPPSTQDYRIGPSGDVWTRMASLMNLLERVEQKIAPTFINEPHAGYDLVRLPEDGVLNGFTPLMVNEDEPTFVSASVDMEAAQFELRVSRLLFFGTVFLCGLEPPVLKLELFRSYQMYVSVVNVSANHDSTPSPPELIDEDELLVERFSDEADEDDKEPAIVDGMASLEIRQLLSRKVELEKRQRIQELHRQRAQKILQQSGVSVHIEVRPKLLVPDTNCFIDYLAMIKTIAASHTYSLMVPLVVLSELEGLARGGKTPAPSLKTSTDPNHILKVAEAAKQALEYLSNRPSNIKCVTTKGTPMTTFTFTVEDDSAASSTSDTSMRNDDKILATCLVLCSKSHLEDQQEEEQPRKLYRDVVLLTEDRNLRVKALARNLPVRELPDFIRWADLG